MANENQSSEKIEQTTEDAVLIEHDSSPEPEVTSNVSENPKPVKRVRTGGLWFVSIINFILLALLIAAAYWYYTNLGQQDDQSEQALSSLEQRFAGHSQTVNNTLNEMQLNDNRVLQQLERLQRADSNSEEAMDDLQQSIELNADTAEALGKRMAELSGRRPSDWLLAEANYLVNMAGRKLYLENDISTAVTLLGEADTRLDDLNDPSLFPVRARIAADIQTLNQINPTSSTAVALAIIGMQPKVSELPLDKLQLPESDVDEDLTVSEDVSDWRDNLSKTWKSLVGDVISIDYAQKPLAPYLSERQQWLIEQQLKHSLSQAQSAALNEEVDLYKSTMQQAMTIVEENYLTDDAEVSQFLSTLQELQNTDFSKQYPSKLESQAALQEVIEQRIQHLYNNQKTIQNDDSGSENQL